MVLVAAVLLTLSAVVVDRSLASYGMPATSFFVDAAGLVSNWGKPHWSERSPDITFPSSIEAVDGRYWHGLSASERGHAWQQALAAATAAGHRELEVTVRRGEATRTVRVPVRTLAPLAWWVYAGAHLFVGILYGAAALLALWISRGGRLAWTFAKFSLAMSIFMLTIFDFHTSHTLAPLFLVAFAFVPTSAVALSLRLPDDVWLLARHQWLERVLDVTGVVAACLLVQGHRLGLLTGFQALWSLFGALAVLGAIGFFLARFLLARGARRAVMRALLGPIVFAPVAGALAFGSWSMGAAWADAVAFPLLGLVPLATAHAVIAHDLWGSRAVLSRAITQLIVGGLACLVSLGPSIAFAATRGVEFRSAALVAAVSGMTAVVMVVLALRAVDKTLFPTLAGYKPSIEQLSEELTLVNSPRDVAAAIERTVRRWLPCDHLVLTLAPPSAIPQAISGFPGRNPSALPAPKPTLSGASPGTKPGPRPSSPARSGWRPEERSPSSPGVPPSAGPRRESAFPEGSWPDISSSIRVIPRGTGAPRGPLALPVTCGGIELGTLEVGEKRGGGLFTNDDLDLLQTIGNLGALALAYAYAFQELEERRRQRAAAWRGEREALVETLAAEVAHEVRYSINYFRNLFERGNEATTLLREDLDIGREEVGRLERMVARLRRQVLNRADRQLVSLDELCARAEVLLQDELSGRHFEVRGPEGILLYCDGDQITQVLVNLLANAVEATNPGETLGLRWEVHDQGLELAVWDRGAGFAAGPAELFAPWFTTKPRGTGLGLAITHRLVRGHGWTIRAERERNETMFAITIGSQDVVMKPPGASPKEDVA